MSSRKSRSSVSRTSVSRSFAIVLFMSVVVMSLHLIHIYILLIIVGVVFGMRAGVLNQGVVKLFGGCVWIWVHHNCLNPDLCLDAAQKMK